VIVGGGPAGLATAIMLARRGWRDIAVYDRLPPPPDPDDEAVWGDTAKVRSQLSGESVWEDTAIE
jgi:2-polyprenyl-6-methoxyphenol hydroxylase-like FAD-dependent oxidoreductase